MLENRDYEKGGGRKKSVRNGLSVEAGQIVPNLLISFGERFGLIDSLNESGKEVSNHKDFLKIFLTDWMEGEDRDCSEYEAVLIKAMESDKLTRNEKLYYLILGLGFANPAGRTLIPVGHLEAIVSEVGSFLPEITNFSGNSSGDFGEWVRMYCQKAEPNGDFDRFIEDFIWREN